MVEPAYVNTWFLPCADTVLEAFVQLGRFLALGLHVQRPLPERPHEHPQDRLHRRTRPGHDRRRSAIRRPGLRLRLQPRRWLRPPDRLGQQHRWWPQCPLPRLQAELDHLWLAGELN